MTLKPQDLLVCLKLALPENGLGSSWSYRELAGSLEMSASEVNAATRRAAAAGLLTRTRARVEKPRPIRPALLEFVTGEAREAFPVTPGPETRGLPTGRSAPPLNALLSGAAGPELVWPDDEGERQGLSIEPLYHSVPEVARGNPDLHEVLALVDALRVGERRERELAERELAERVTGLTHR